MNDEDRFYGPANMSVAMRLMAKDQVERKRVVSKDESEITVDNVIEYYLAEAWKLQTPLGGKREGLGWNRDCHSTKHNPEAYYCPDCQP